MYGSASISSFQRKLAVVNGSRTNVIKNIQCEFQVPLSQLTGLYDTLQGSCQYVWPRLVTDTTTKEKSAMHFPMNASDMLTMAQYFWTGGGTGLTDYQRWLSVKYRAQYTLRNQNNFPTRYEVIRFRAKRNVPWVDPTNTTAKSYGNLMNVAGNWIHRTGQPAGAGTPDATHEALHIIDTKVEQLPPIKWAFSCKKKLIKLEPGEQREFSVSGGKSFTKVEMIGQEIEGQSLSHVVNDVWRGTEFIVFKMYSEPADYADAETDIWLAKSTRSTPVCLLTYRIHYNVVKPLAHADISLLDLGQTGLVAVPVAANIGNMADDDEKVKAEANAL